MGVTIAQIIATYPGIKDDTDIDLYIELAKTQIGSSFYGARYNEAVALRATHNLVMSKPLEYAASMSGGIVSKQQGSLAVEYGRSSGDNNMDKSGLSQTVYGKQLIALMRMSAPTIGAIGTLS